MGIESPQSCEVLKEPEGLSFSLTEIAEYARRYPEILACAQETQREIDACERWMWQDIAMYMGWNTESSKSYSFPEPQSA